MSDLPPSVGRAHRGAHRDYIRRTTPGESMTETEKRALKTGAKTKVPKVALSVRNQRKEFEKPGQGLKQSDILAFNHEAEKCFVKLISEFLHEDDSISYREAVREAAFELNISIETAKRYLEKHSARRAEFCIEDGNVTLRIKR